MKAIITIIDDEGCVIKANEVVDPSSVVYVEDEIAMHKSYTFKYTISTSTIDV